MNIALMNIKELCELRDALDVLNDYGMSTEENTDIYNRVINEINSRDESISSKFEPTKLLGGTDGSDS